MHLSWRAYVVFLDLVWSLSSHRPAPLPTPSCIAGSLKSASHLRALGRILDRSMSLSEVLRGLWGSSLMFGVELSQVGYSSIPILLPPHDDSLGWVPGLSPLPREWWEVGAGPTLLRLCLHASCLTLSSTPFPGGVAAGRGRP